MKPQIITTALAIALAVPATMRAQYTQELPAVVKEVRLEDNAYLTVRQGERDRIEVRGTDKKQAIGRINGSLLTISDMTDGATLYLSPGRTLTLNAQDFTRLTIEGDFKPFGQLTLHAEDYARVEIDGTEGDTLRARKLVLKAEDFSRIDGKIAVQFFESDFTADDYSRIALQATANANRLGNADSAGENMTSENKSSCAKTAGLYVGRHTIDGTLIRENYENTDGIDSYVGIVSTLANSVPEIVHKKWTKYAVHPWSSDFTVAFGWHNWGNAIGNGLGGVESDASVKTSLNHWLVSYSVPLINVRGFALTAGLGLEWDKYKFTERAVDFVATGSTMTFQNTGVASAERSWLKTRYVVLPIELKFGNPDGWQISLTALPGLAWTGKNTGMRQKASQGLVDYSTKDYTVNKHLNPYKFDVRLAVKYDWIGAYLQVSTLSAFKKDSEDLFPVKFGIII